MDEDLVYIWFIIHAFHFDKNNISPTKIKGSSNFWVYSDILLIRHIIRHIAYKQVLSILANPGQTLKTLINAFQFLFDHFLQSWVILLWSTKTEHFQLKLVKGQLQSYIFHIWLCHCCNAMPHMFHQLGIVLQEEVAFVPLEWSFFPDRLPVFH